MARSDARDIKILHAALLSANAPADSVGSSIGEQGYQVRRSISALQKNGTAQPYTLVNQFLLGWMKIGVYFSFLHEAPIDIEKATEKILSYPNVGTLEEVFGSYQYFMSINARNGQPPF